MCCRIRCTTGSGVFEGIRCYKVPDEDKSYVFRLRDHMERLHRSCQDCPDRVALQRRRADGRHVGSHPCQQASGLLYPPIGIPRLRRHGGRPDRGAVDVVIAVWPWDAYLGADALENGVAVGISSWRQRSNNAIPPAVKATASYMNSILAKMEAKAHGYAPRPSC